MCSSGVSPGIHKQPYEVAFLSNFLSAISLVASNSLGFPVLVLHPKSFGFSYLFHCAFLAIMTKQLEDKEKKSNEACCRLLGPLLLKWERKAPHLRSFRGLAIIFNILSI